MCQQWMRDASQKIRTFLQQAVPEAIVVLESYAGSQRNWVEDILRRWCDEEEMDLVLTVGATMPAPGPSSLEIVPEATAAVLERHLPGFGESMRAYAQEQTELAMLDRSIAGIRGRTLIVNLPQGAEAALLFLEAIGELILPVNLYLQESPAAPWLSNELTIEAEEEKSVTAVERDEGCGRRFRAPRSR